MQVSKSKSSKSLNRKSQKSSPFYIYENQHFLDFKKKIKGDLHNISFTQLLWQHRHQQKILVSAAELF